MIKFLYFYFEWPSDIKPMIEMSDADVAAEQRIKMH